MSFTIDEDMKALLEGDVTVVLATRDADLAPELGSAWGPRVLAGGREVELFIDSSRAEQTLANLRSNRALAVTFSSPITYQTVQIKGWCTEIGEPRPQDEAWIERHREAFTESVRARGLPAHVSRNFWCKDVTRVRMAVEAAFDQTPGPRAGDPL